MRVRIFICFGVRFIDRLRSRADGPAVGEAGRGRCDGGVQGAAAVERPGVRLGGSGRLGAGGDGHFFRHRRIERLEPVAGLPQLGGLTGEPGVDGGGGGGEQAPPDPLPALIGREHRHRRPVHVLEHIAASAAVAVRGPVFAAALVALLSRPGPARVAVAGVGIPVGGLVGRPAEPFQQFAALRFVSGHVLAAGAGH
jgi:hypothetical protein